MAMDTKTKIIGLLFDKALIKVIVLILLEIILANLWNYLPKTSFIQTILIIANSIIIIYLFVILIYISKQSFTYLMNPKNLKALLIAYVLFVFTILFLFSTLYQLVEITKMGYLKYGECTNNFDSSMVSLDSTISHEFFYFSAITFFTVG